MSAPGFRTEAALQPVRNVILEAIKTKHAIDWEKEKLPIGEPEPGQWEVLYKVVEGKRKPAAPVYLEYPTEPHAAWFQASAEHYARAYSRWAEEVRQIEAENQRRYDESAAAFEGWNAWTAKQEQEQIEYNKIITKAEADYRALLPIGIANYCKLVLTRFNYPKSFPRELNAEYIPETRILIVDHSLPAPENLPRVKDVKFVGAQNEPDEVFFSDAELNHNYDDVLYQICLGTLYALFDADVMNVLDMIVFNGWVKSVDRSTGNDTNGCVLSVQVKKEEFQNINLARVDPKACFKALKGIGSSKLHSLTPIAPVLNISCEAKRNPETTKQALETLSEPMLQIVRTVVDVMLPLGEGVNSKDIQEKAREIIQRLVIPPHGKSEVDLSNVQARQLLDELLASIHYEAPEQCLGDIADLSSYERMNLLIDTATGFLNGYRQWKEGQNRVVFDTWPAQEFYRQENREVPRDWPSRWSAAGGQFFPGKSDYPGSRMIALKNDPIWETISAFGLPFPPFAFQSGMGVRDIERGEAIELGLIEKPQRILPAAFAATDELRERLAVKLRESLARLEEDEEKRLADPLNFGTGYDLLDLAEEKLEESEKLTPEQTLEIKTIIEKAIERGFGSNPDWPAKVYHSLSFVYASINEQEKATSYEKKASELEVAHLISRGSSYDLVKTAEALLTNAQEMTPDISKKIMILIERAFEKGVGEKYNLRAKAHKVLSQVYARTQESAKAEANRVQYVEHADGFLLLEDAKAELASIGKTIALETGAQILDMLAKAVQRLPEHCPHLHAEAYRATAEIQEALGDNDHAVEYYEYALSKNPKIGVKRRLDALRKPKGDRAERP
jgi:tetratricopeptide (TPR) repeat protein